MPKYTITNRTASLVVLPVSPSVKIQAHQQREIVADATDMGAPAMVALVNKGLVSISVGNDPGTPDNLEINPATIGGVNVDTAALPTDGSVLRIPGVSQVGNASLLDAPAVTLYVETAGDDITGDGSQANPFATPQRAFDEMPDGLNLFASVRVGPGTFDFPVFNRTLGPGGYVLLNGDHATVAIDLTSDLSGSLNAGTTSQYTDSTVGAHAGVDPSTHWLVSDTGAYVTGRPVLASASGEVQYLNATANPVTYAKVAAYTTTFSLPTYGALAGGTNINHKDKVYISGVLVTGTSNGKIRNCAVLGAHLPDAYASAYDANLFVSTAGDLLVDGSAMSISDSVLAGALDMMGRVSFTTSAVHGVATVGARADSAASVVTADIDLAVGGKFVVKAGASLSLNGLSSAAANTVIVEAEQMATVVRTGSVCTAVALAGVAVVLTDGAQAFGMGACFASVTNSATPGDEIKVGAAVVQTFASLPATDTTELCRAT